MTGLVPGVSLINAIAVANNDKAVYATTAGTTNPTFDTLKADGTAGKDGLVTQAEATAALGTANTARTAAGDATSTVTNNLANANTALVAAKASAVAAGNTTLVSNYDAAVAAQKVLIGTATAVDAKAAAVAVENAALAGADSALTANAALTGAALAAAVTYATLTTKFNAATTPAGTQTTFDSASLKIALDTPATTVAQIAAKAALTTELAKLPTYGQQSLDAATKVAALTTAETNLATATTGTISDYTTKAAAAATLSDTLVKVTAADAAVTAAKLVVDKYTALDTSITTAKGALAAFATANADKVTLTDVAATATAVQATAKADVFYFSTKAVAANDFAIGGTTNFGAGDSIVLGSTYTFNSGALSTGNSNTLEFFLVKGATGTQVVIETEAFGNANNAVDASGNVTASPSAVVINLVGVTADHLSVANGVVSYV